MNLEKEVFDISLNDIIPNRFQPREIFEDESLQELSESIKQHGVIQPIIVRKVGDKYEIIAGERRYRASKKAGKETIPALVRDIDDKEAAKIALLENLQRSNLTPIEEAKTYQTILKIDNITQEELAANLGKSQSTIANKMRLLSLAEEVQTALLNNQISERHARSLLGLDRVKQIELLNRTLNEKLTVRQLDEEILKLTGKMPSNVEPVPTNETEEKKETDFFENSVKPNLNENSMPDIREMQQENQVLTTQMPEIIQEPDLNSHQNETQNNISEQNLNNTPNIIPNLNPNETQNNISNLGSNVLSNEQPVNQEEITKNSIPEFNLNIPQQPEAAQEQNNPNVPNIPKGQENVFEKLRVKRQEESEKPLINSLQEPMQSENQITEQNNNLNNNFNNIYDLRFAINNFRQAIQNTEKFGFKVNAKETDGPDKYQIVIEIDKK